MTRYSLRPRSDSTGLFEIAIGWDRSLQTFFVTVFGPPTCDEGDPGVILWRGASPHELTRARDAVRIAGDYAEIPDDLAARLEIDRLSDVGTGDGPAQSWAKKWIGAPERP